MAVAEAGNHLNFTYKVTGQYKPVVTWSKFEGRLPISRNIMSGGNLIIMNAITNDSGSYVYTATSIVGSSSSSVQLQVHSALKFITRPPSYVLVYAGQTLNLSCSASSGLKTTVTWVFNGTLSLPEGSATDADNLIVALLANITHGGNYTCSAMNALSSLYANVIVHVKIPETCSSLKTNISDVSGDYDIVPDGDQGGAPFMEYCNMTYKEGIGVTAVSHDSQERIRVKGFGEKGSYQRDIHYVGSSLSQLKGLTEVSKSCQQFIKYG